MSVLNSNFIIVFSLFFLSLAFVYTGVQSSSRELLSQQSVHNPLRIQNQLTQMKMVLDYNTNTDTAEDNVKNFNNALFASLKDDKIMLYVHSVWVYLYDNKKDSFIIDRTQSYTFPYLMNDTNTSWIYQAKGMNQSEVLWDTIYEDKFVFRMSFMPVFTPLVNSETNQLYGVMAFMFPLYF